MTTLPGYSDTMNRVAQAIWKAEHDVMNGRMRDQYFELRIHPDHLNSVIQTIDGAALGLLNLEAAAKLVGVTIVRDTDVEPGHPVLKCTWQMTL